MIHIGLTTWSEHQTLAPDKNKITLPIYADFFDVVEVDTFYYGLRGPEVTQKWLTQVPSDFQFIIKGHQAMTQQGDLNGVADSEEDLFNKFRRSIQPLVNAGQLANVLLQFPPQFVRNTANLSYLIKVQHWLAGLPVAIEFRHPSWYQPIVAEQVQSTFKGLDFSLVIADEAQTPNNSVPFQPAITTTRSVFLRLHGRNYQGWLGGKGEWRSQRTLYRYNDEELHEFARVVQNLAEKAADVYIIFNNNSGGDAADNARALQGILGIDPPGSPTEQLALF